jgi:predicted DNA-binding transcriptional regulator AlpA
MARQLLPLTLNAAEVGELLGYKAETVRDLSRADRIPGPIDASLGPKLWRWSRREVELYVERGVQAVAS